MRSVLATLMMLALFVASCATDPYLTCGTKCSDGNAPADASEASYETGPGDSAMCRSNGNDCQTGTQCCSGMCITTKCAAPGCHALGDSCMSSMDCCSGRCSSGDSGPKQCISD